MVGDVTGKGVKETENGGKCDREKRENGVKR